MQCPHDWWFTVSQSNDKTMPGLVRCSKEVSWACYRMLRVLNCTKLCHSSPIAWSIIKNGFAMLTVWNTIFRIISGTVAALLITACGGGGGTEIADAPARIKAESAGAVGHFQRLNEVRAALGLRALSWDDALYTSAAAHARYLELNRTRGHEEEAELAGFYGRYIWERTAKAGFAGTLVQETIISGQGLTLEQGRQRMDTILMTPVHRIQVISEEFDQAAVAVSGEGGLLVTNLGQSPSYRPYMRRVILFPYDGMVGIAPRMYPGSEVGLPEDLPYETGTPLTVSAGQFSRMSYTTVSLRDSAGNEIDLIRQTLPGEAVGALIFFPTSPLAPNTRYTWSIHVAVERLQPTTLTARFTTGS